ncbi:MAG: tRNA (N(6)-L-threonylcarbamoyladenosine(37)-C(2))-methylthiotransferase [Candidatus Sumerlaeaceae bacterium]|nr:tRNA (N(6)-L-threonylcarbamoyladenosine(37)-C(2))-methylthiotransferase [Candidatus Sumerlaeaceae bacterium]
MQPAIETKDHTRQTGHGMCRRVYIETYGCTFNASDSEVMAGILECAGYALVSSAENADVVIVNSCIVKERSYLDLRRRVGELSSLKNYEGKNPAVVLAGCAPKVPHHQREFAHLPQVGPDTVSSIGEVVEEALHGRVVHRVERLHTERLRLPKRRRTPAIEIVPISKGCLGKCTFCQTVLARGRLHSFPEEQIEAAVLAALAEGVRIVWLTSQDCGAYGKDIGSSLPHLLRRLVRVPGDFKIRLGMVNPNWAKLFADELAEILAHPRFYRFAHLPIQSGSDTVLRAMRREYTVADVLETCETLRKHVPDISIATDIIAGFPTETEEDWASTLDALKQIQPAVVNRSRFSPRPGTAAAHLKPLPSRIVAQRSRELYYLTSSLVSHHLSSRLGKVLEAVVEECPKPNVAVGRGPAYEPIILQGSYVPGTALMAEITHVEGFHLRGRPTASPPFAPKEDEMIMAGWFPAD